MIGNHWLVYLVECEHIDLTCFGLSSRVWTHWPDILEYITRTAEL